MAGPRTRLAEIAGSGNDAHAKVVLPDAIYHHAGEQGVLRRGQPTREGGAPPATDPTGRPRIDAIRVFGRTERCRHAWLHFRSWRVVLTADQKVMDRRIRIALDEN